MSETPTLWYPIPLSLGVAVVVALNFYKGKSWQQDPESKREVASTSQVSVKGPWQVRASLSQFVMSRLSSDDSNRFTSSVHSLYEPSLESTAPSILTLFPSG